MQIGELLSRIIWSLFLFSAILLSRPSFASPCEITSNYNRNFLCTLMTPAEQKNYPGFSVKCDYSVPHSRCRCIYKELRDAVTEERDDFEGCHMSGFGNLEDDAEKNCTAHAPPTTELKPSEKCADLATTCLQVENKNDGTVSKLSKYVEDQLRFARTGALKGWTLEGCTRNSYEINCQYKRKGQKRVCRAGFKIKLTKGSKPLTCASADNIVIPDNNCK